MYLDSKGTIGLLTVALEFPTQTCFKCYVLPNSSAAAKETTKELQTSGAEQTQAMDHYNQLERLEVRLVTCCVNESITPRSHRVTSLKFITCDYSIIGLSLS